MFWVTLMSRSSAYAVLGVDLETLVASVLVLDHLYTPGGNAVPARPLGQLTCRERRVFQRQVARLSSSWLVLAKTLSSLAGILPSGFDSDFCLIVFGGMIRVVMHGDRQLAVEQVDVHERKSGADEVAELVLCRAKVTGVQLFVHPAAFEGCLVLGQLVAATATRASARISAATMPDFMAVWVPLILAKFRCRRYSPPADHPGRSSSAETAGHRCGTGAVGNALAAFQVLFDFRVGLPALHLVKRRDVRVK